MCFGANKTEELGYVESGSYGKWEIDVYEWPRRRLSFEKVVTKADLRPSFRYHNLRHTSCSRLVAEGVQPLEVQQRTGHKSFTTTLRYAYLSPEHRKQAIEKIKF